MCIFIIIHILALLYGLSSEATINCRTEYHRSCFKHWTDDDRDCLNTRHELLQETSLNPIKIENCKVVSGLWFDEYSGKYYSNPKDLEIDHIVPLKEAWRSGANEWTQKEREIFANDMDAIIPVYFSLNGQKSDRDPSDWLPPLKEYRCEYITRYVYIKQRYVLKKDDKEAQTIKTILRECN